MMMQGKTERYNKQQAENEEEDPKYSAISMATMNTENIYTEAAATNTKNSLQKSDTIEGVQKGKKLVYLVAISLSVVTLMLIFGCFVALFLEIANLKSKTASFQQISQSLASQNDNIQQLNASIDMIKQQQLNIFATDLSNQLTTLQNKTEVIREGLREAGFYYFYPAVSCAALPPISPSGYYWVRAFNGSAVRVYCDMTRSCGGVTGGWMRVAELDMTNSSHQCPSGFRELTDSSKRTCVFTSTNKTVCSTTLFSSALEYSKVCGKLIGYQIGGTDGFSRNLPIDQNYVDGVTLTHGNPRQHIWTFAAALSEVVINSTGNCPCTTNQPNKGTPPPAFVGEDYFCDTGSSASVEQGVFYGADPLWDGAGCGPQSTCCSFNTPPWFYKQLSNSTTDDIEMRVCRNDLASDEDIAIESVEIYVQ